MAVQYLSIHNHVMLKYIDFEKILHTHFNYTYKLNI